MKCLEKKYFFSATTINKLIEKKTLLDRCEFISWHTKKPTPFNVV